MALNPQYSRISHHAITTAGATFSVPPGEDFTVIGGTLSWNVTGTELADREFGLNTTDNKAYLRIGSNINELLFVGGTANDQSFAETLAINNNSQTYNLIMGTSTYIGSSNTGGRIDLDYGGVGGEVYITTDNGTGNLPALVLSGVTGAILQNYSGDVNLTTNYEKILISDGNGIDIVSYDSAPVTINSGTVSITNSVINMNSHKIVNLATGSNNLDAVNVGQLNAATASIFNYGFMTQQMVEGLI